MECRVSILRITLMIWESSTLGLFGIGVGALGFGSSGLGGGGGAWERKPLHPETGDSMPLGVPREPNAPSLRNMA